MASSVSSGIAHATVHYLEMIDFDNIVRRYSIGEFLFIM